MCSAMGVLQSPGALVHPIPLRPLPHGQDDIPVHSQLVGQQGRELPPPLNGHLVKEREAPGSQLLGAPGTHQVLGAHKIVIGHVHNFADGPIKTGKLHSCSV